jgi:histidinol-phosphate aminotransferase
MRIHHRGTEGTEVKGLRTKDESAVLQPTAYSLGDNAMADIETSVSEVIRAVRERGDEALIEFARRWDRADLRDGLRVPREAIEAADDRTPFAAALRRAVERIRRFHEAVRPRSIRVEDPEGVRMELRWTPIASVGLYVPGGKASYPSTLAMTAVPAQVAGVGRIVAVSPPGPSGEVAPQVLLAAKILGIKEVYRVGGAGAIAALALGTATVPRVDKVFGPGNAYVTEAKRQLFGVVGVDLLAGPSEVVVYADGSADPDWAAADLIAQAEHDESARPILIATREDVLARIREALERRTAAEPRRDVIRASIERNGQFLVIADEAEAAARIDAIAPEHLSIQSAEPGRLLALVRNAGAIYAGGSSPVALGDYYAGPNHVLPTGGAARYASALSVEDFMKRSNVVEASEAFLRARGEDVTTLAEGEGLPGHASSVRARMGDAGEPSGGAGSAGGPHLVEVEARPRAGLAATEAYHLVEEEGEVKLNQNESPWDIPRELKDRIFAKMRDQSWNRYPQKLPEEFRRRIARDEGFPEEGVWAGTGSNLILQWIFEAFGGPGRTALIPRPSFSLYRMWGRVSETRIEEYSLGEDFRYDGEAIARRIEELRPELTVLCLPNNPTGSDLEPAEVARAADAAARAGGILVVDEAYREFARPSLDRTGIARERGNVVLVRTYSKAFAAAGLRIGYLLTSARIGRELGKIVPPFHLSLFHAVAGQTLWESRDLFANRVVRLTAERERLREALGKVPGVTVFPSEANFFLIRVADAAVLFAALKRKGILVRKPGDDPLLAGCLRINAGTPEENDRLIAAVREGR